MTTASMDIPQEFSDDVGGIFSDAINEEMQTIRKVAKFLFKQGRKGGFTDTEIKSWIRQTVKGRYSRKGQKRLTRVLNSVAKKIKRPKAVIRKSR